jgi:hypothetical protein
LAASSALASSLSKSRRVVTVYRGIVNDLSSESNTKAQLLLSARLLLLQSQWAAIPSEIPLWI